MAMPVAVYPAWMARVRVGPLSYGPKGRRGIHAGPFSASYNVHNPAFGAFMLLVVVLAVVSKIWPLLLVGAVVFVPVWLVTKGKRDASAAEARRQAAIRDETAQRLAAERDAAEAQARAKAQREWLEGPPPTLYVPRRFSEDWFATNVPHLHPGQVPTLVEEMRARGWSEQRIQQRLPRYLVQNQFWMVERESM
jgi:hypothetical protein